MSGGRTTTTRYTALRKDGSTFPCLVHSTAIIHNGKPIGLRGIIVDITDLQRTEDALRESETKYRQLLELAPAGICEVDVTRMKLLSVSKTLCDYLGYTREELLEINPLDALAEESKGFFLERQKRILAGEKVRNTAEYKLKFRDGREFWALANARYFHEEGKPVRATYVLQDITDRKQYEIQFLQAQKMEAIGRLAGGIAHDFNNILTSLLGHSELLLSSIQESDPLRGRIEEIKRAGERAADLTRQLLAFSRRQVLQPRVLDLNHLIKDLEAMLVRLIGEDIHLETDLFSHLGRIEADQAQMEQVIMNLVVNARDAMPLGGKLTLRTDNVDLEQAKPVNEFEVKPGTYVMLTVTDTGVGIPEEVQKRIFEPFYTTKGLGKGTGLGLSTVYGIVKQSGGYVWAQSQPGQSATFTIYLPRLDVEAGILIRENGASGEILQGTESILVVEDDNDVRGLIQSILQGMGYEVHALESAAKALEFCREHPGPLDLLLTDVVMPGISGRSLAELALDLRPKLKVLFMSGYPFDTLSQHGVLETGIYLIQKPFAPVGISRKIREVLNGK